MAKLHHHVRWERGLAAAIMASVLAVAPSAVLAAGDVNKAACASETEASPGFRTYLPDCRAYELVTPPYKEAGIPFPSGAAIGAISTDGAHVISGIGGVFAGAGNLWANSGGYSSGAAYELARTATGWQPTALTPPATVYPDGAILAVDADDFGATLWGLSTRTLNIGEFAEGIYMRNNAGEFSPVGPGIAPEVASEVVTTQGEELDFVGASRNLTRSLFRVEAFDATLRSSHSGHNNLWPGDTTEPEALSLYQYTGTGNSEPSLVGVKNNGPLTGSPINAGADLVSKCGTILGSGAEAHGSMYNAVSGDGETVFFTALHSSKSDTCTTPAVNELYARIKQSETVDLSEPKLSAGECSAGEPCSGATPESAVFQGASEDGQRVFFESEQPLINGAPAAGKKLYEATLEPTPEGSTAVSQLANVSADPTSGQSPEVQGVVRVSEDGSHVYFVAKGVLAGMNHEGHEPEAGADNLYVYEPASERPGEYHTAFIATLLTPSEEATLVSKEAEEASAIAKQAEAIDESEANAIFFEYESGAIEFERALELLAEAGERATEFIIRNTGTRGPAGTLSEDKSVWQSSDNRPAQATPGGRYLVFPSSADLGARDESTVPQLFEYDAGDETLTRVSIGADQTYDDDGNVDAFRDAPTIPAQLFSESDRPTAAQSASAISEDGFLVFFTSMAGLVPQAQRGVSNVYEYREGEVYLISDGLDATYSTDGPTVQFVGTDPSGQDAFFLTADQLVPQDAETQAALYDAREAGGFPAPTGNLGCAQEICRGPAATPPQLPSPGSASQPGGGNLVPPPPAVVKPKPKANAKQCKKRLVKKNRKCVHGKRRKDKKKATKSSDAPRASR